MRHGQRKCVAMCQAAVASVWTRVAWGRAVTRVSGCGPGDTRVLTWRCSRRFARFPAAETLARNLRGMYRIQIATYIRSIQISIFFGKFCIYIHFSMLLCVYMKKSYEWNPQLQSTTGEPSPKINKIALKIDI